MHRFLILSLFLFATFGFSTIKDSPTGAQEERSIVIKAISGLQYDVVRFAVKPGETVNITLINTDEMSHNMLITEPGQRKAVVSLAAAMGDQGPAQGYVPETEKVLAAIPVLEPGKQKKMKFQAPEQEGVYPYVCTYPGHGMVMYGAMYVTNNQLPPLASDQHIPPQRRETETSEAKESGHPWPDMLPTMYRTFMPETGPASIAVGMLGDISYCWDAGQCRLRYAWKGGFIDLTRHWSGKGKERADIVGVVFYRDYTDFPFRIGNKEHIPAVKYLGYSMKNRYPTFKYMLDGVEVTERIIPTFEKPGFKRILTFKNLDKNLWFLKDDDNSVNYYSNRGQWNGNSLMLSPQEAQEFIITITEKSEEI